MILVDSNVLIDVIAPDQAWREWSANKLTEVGEAEELAINPIVFAEISMQYETIRQVDAALAPTGLVRLPLPYEAAFLAGKAHVTYRKRGGERRSPLPDFFVGAHAEVAGLTLLTRDAARYRTYFPAVPLIAP